MKAVVISDTQGMVENAKNILKNIKDVSAVIHLGDYVRDAKRLEREFPCYKFFYVSGNNDWDTDVAYEKTIELCGRKLLLTHGHRQAVAYGFLQLALWAEEKNADAVLFGHIHMPVIDEYKNIEIFSPGSISLPRNTTAPTFGVIEVDNKNIEFSIYMYNEIGTYIKLDKFEKKF